MKKLISANLLRLLAIWSLIPSYLLAGGIIGYGLDRWFRTFPYLTGVAILFAFTLAISDMLRLRDEVFKKNH